jgi:hypothetical protein
LINIVCNIEMNAFLLISDEKKNESVSSLDGSFSIKRFRGNDFYSSDEESDEDDDQRRGKRFVARSFD